eukprot:m.15192 g.15192  ORF g.15192 m.15192 type:complete len:178 (-) comp4887_c0_seq1:67-600(-)
MMAGVVGAAAPKRLTLLLLRAGGSVLLGMKKRGFGEGKVNGFGGKVEIGETIAEAAVREMQEESGLTVENASLRGILTFHMRGDGNQLEVHVFHASEYHGELVENDEMEPFWVKESEIPFDRMWLDDQHWIPTFLNEDIFRGVFTFESHDELVDYKVDKVKPTALEAILPSTWRRTV